MPGPKTGSGSGLMGSLVYSQGSLCASQEIADSGLVSLGRSSKAVRVKASENRRDSFIALAGYRVTGCSGMKVAPGAEKPARRPGRDPGDGEDATGD